MIDDYIHSLPFVCKLFQSILLKFSRTCFVFTFHQIIHSRPIKPREGGGDGSSIRPRNNNDYCSKWGRRGVRTLDWRVANLYTLSILSYYFKDDTKYTLRYFTKNVWIGDCVNQDSNLRNKSSCLKGCDEFRDRGTGQLLLYYLWTRWLSLPLLLRVTSGSFRFCLRSSTPPPSHN